MLFQNNTSRDGISLNAYRQRFPWLLRWRKLHTICRLTRQAFYFCFSHYPDLTFKARRPLWLNRKFAIL
jgi:hypothetical protein